LADPGIAIERRIARGIAVVKNTVDEEAALLEPATLNDMRNLLKGLDKWRQLRSFTETARLPKPTQLFALACPEGGEHDYKRLCNATHGSLITVITGHLAATMDAVERKAEAWWMVLTACRYGLQAAMRITDMQRNEPPQSVQYAAMAHSHYFDSCRKWEHAHRSQT
jgi:hypothetical protein